MTAPVTGRRLGDLRAAAGILGWDLPLFAAATALDQGGRLLVNLVAAAILGPLVFGTWVLLALVLQYSFVLSVGIIQGTAREVPRLLGAGRPEAAAEVEDVAVATTVGTALLASSVAVLAGPRLFGPDDGSGPLTALLFGAALVLNQLFLLQQVLFRSRLRFRPASIQLAVQGLAAAVVGIGLLAGGAGLDGLLGARVAVFVVALILATRLLARVPRPTWNGRLTLDLVRLGLPLLAASVLFILLATIDRWLVLVLLGREAVGVYGLVGLVVTGLLLLPTVVSQQYYPRLAFARGQGRNGPALLRMAGQQGLLAAALTGLVAAVVAVTAIEAIPIFLPAYDRAIRPILIVLTGLVAYAAASAYGNLLNLLDRQRVLLALQGLVLAADVVAAVSLVGLGLGLDGVALASGGAMSLYAGLLGLAARRAARDAGTADGR